MKKEFKIQRYITFYEKGGDAFIGEECLLEDVFPLTTLKSYFGENCNDPLLYEQYDINKNIAKAINEKTKFEFDFSKYDYFLETFNVSIDLETGNGVRLKGN